MSSDGGILGTRGLTRKEISEGGPGFWGDPSVSSKSAVGGKTSPNGKQFKGPVACATANESRKTADRTSRLSASRMQEEDSEYTPTGVTRSRNASPWFVTAMNVELEEVGRNAVKQADRRGDPVIGQALHRLYDRSFYDPLLRDVIEAVLSQRPSKNQNEDFEKYLQGATKEIRTESGLAGPFSRTRSTSSKLKISNLLNNSRPTDGIVVRGENALEPVSTKTTEPRNWNLRSSSKQQPPKYMNLRSRSKQKPHRKAVQPISTPPVTDDDSVSAHEGHHHGTGPACGRKSLIVILRLPKRKSLIVILRLPEKINQTPPSSELVTTDEVGLSSSMRSDNRRTRTVMEPTDYMKRKKRRLFSDLISNDAASVYNTAGLQYPSPISICSATRSPTGITQQSPTIRVSRSRGMTAGSNRITLPADKDVGEPALNQAVMPIVNQDLTPGTSRPPGSPTNIFESGHPLFVVTGNMWLN
ncbi:MAG: hypothetical protein Q9226_005625 [Calogaya cf. arnoldii]